MPDRVEPFVINIEEAALADLRQRLDWLHRGRSRRVVTLTEAGQAGLQETFGLPRDWAERS